MESIGNVNCYVCENCGAVHGTINLNTGVTPFTIMCKSCGAIAQSSIYRLPEGETGCGWAWYRPIPSIFRTLPTPAQDHVLAGGLLLTELEGVVNLRETDEDYEILSSHNFEEITSYLRNAYRGTFLPSNKRKEDTDTHRAARPTKGP